MNWDIIGATGEWAGAIAVVASLLYLARQIRLTNQQARAAARYSFLDAYGQANGAISGTLESSSVFRRGMDDEGLSDDEKMQFIILMGQFLNTWSVMYDLHEEGELPANQWALVKSDIHSAFITPGGRKFWDALGKLNVHESFGQFVEQLLESDGKYYLLSPTHATDD